MLELKLRHSELAPPLPLGPPLARPLPGPFDALRHPPLARRPFSQTLRAPSVPAPARSLPQFQETGAGGREMPRPPLHPLRSGRKETRRPSSSLLEPGAGTENAASRLSRSPAASMPSNPAPLPSMRPFRDRLTHIGLACACQLGRVAPKRNHPQTPPWNESWTADERQRRSVHPSFQIASAPQSPRTLC